MAATVLGLSGFNRFNTDLEERWQTFLTNRQTRLLQQKRYGSVPEKVAEDILKDFFNIALDWPLGNINNQVQYADMVLTHQGIKRLVVEAKQPGSISWNKLSLARALEQAYRYAQQQRVTTIAVSDGVIFYAADIQHGGISDRVRLYLGEDNASPDLYWVSVDGIYRPVEPLAREPFILAPRRTLAPALEENINDQNPPILHPKYKVPAQCFAYVGNPLKTSTWKLPCRLPDGTADEGRLPGAIRAVLTNYRGAYNKSVPEEAIPDVLVRLGKAAWSARKMPEQSTKPLASYQLLHDALYQLGRLDEIKQA